MIRSLNIVIPCHNEEKNIPNLFNEIILALEQMGVQRGGTTLFFVDDGSTDKTLDVIKDLKHEKLKVEYISFTRNFGKEAAILAGLKAVYLNGASGYTCIMDADLQDPPELLDEMINILELNPDIDCVGARRITRTGENIVRSLCASIYYKLYNLLTDTELPEGVRDYRMMRENVLRTLVTLPETSRFSKGLFAWMGYTTYYIEYKNNERKNGDSAWSFHGLIKYGIEGIVSFSPKPLELSVLIGGGSCVLSLLMIGCFLYQKYVCHSLVQGYAMIVCLILALGGLQLLCIGLLGIYMARIFSEIKQRPMYVIKEHTKLDSIDEKE